LKELTLLRLSSTIRIETPRRFALVDNNITLVTGNEIVWQVNGYPMVGKYFRHAIITEGCETIEGSL